MKEKYIMLVLIWVLLIGFVLMSGCIGNEGGQDGNKTSESVNKTNKSSCDNDAGVCKVPLNLGGNET
ncbi:MAG: hypothetical protein BWK75_05385 [Candidatus Altiarchaeales archaeon A3]|nr:MAG: hypothetical protein BWK75_05385 [Candidatus Altiarchaeales archaeon A3]